jgi:hypothetical protein
MPIPKTLLRLVRLPLLADIFAFAGLTAYAALLWQVTRLQFSVLDEGLYLYKGILLASGVYIPFQDNGLWMNQMPLAYLIPGWVQVIFGAGLQTGRNYALALGILSGLGWWLTARRLSNPWAASLIPWAMALNPAAARMVGMAASQGLVACLLAWVFFFGLGKNRLPWQTFLAGALAGILVMVRINLLLLLPLLFLYSLWEQGKLRAVWLLAGILLTFGGTHAAYFPNILRLWARWLPLPFLAPFYPPPNIPTWQPDSPLGFKVASLFLAFRYHFLALFGALAAFVFGTGRQPQTRKMILFLWLFLLSSLAIHAWASLGNEYCVFCFPTYLTFFAGAGLLLGVISLAGGSLAAPAWRKAIVSLLTLVLLSGMAYSAEGTVRDLLPVNFYRRLVSTPVPGTEGILLWQMWVNKFGGNLRSVTDGAQVLVPVLAALGLGLFVFSAGSLFVGRKNSAAWGAGFAVFVLAGGVFSGASLLGGEYRAYDCPSSVLPGYEAVGRQLAEGIPAGAKVYWSGYSPVPLLYLPEIEILPGQLHGGYAFRLAEDDEAVLRYGWWNQSLAEGWLAQADVLIVEERNLGKDDWLNAQLPAFFEESFRTAPQSCEARSALVVFNRKK